MEWVLISDKVSFDLITSDLKEELELIIKNQSIKELQIVSAFVTRSGALQLLNWLKTYLNPISSIKVITGTYTDFTSPDAIQLLHDEASVAIRVLDNQNKNLHAKAYLLEDEQSNGYIFIGSSNLTSTGLQENIEWNAKIFSFNDYDQYLIQKQKYESLWNLAQEIDDKWIEHYRLRYKYSNAFDRAREERDLRGDVPTPRYAQIEALQELERTRRLGYDKALAVLATGLGKTHLSAFDSLNYRKVLFIAHRHEILKQSERVYNEVRRFGKTGQFEEGWHTKSDSDVLFATVQKLSRTKTLEQFNSDAFDYIIIDEFHHAQAKSYKRILDYFDAQFLLGLTATPFRMDRKDISDLCDGNVPYNCTMRQAIDQEWLSTFEYFGIYDDTIDYSVIPWKRTQGYDSKELTTQLIREERANKILEEYLSHPTDPTVGFCVSIEHADFMTKFFNEKGIPSIAVHSGKGALTPGLAKGKIESEQAKIIFAVDTFNEGIDLPNIRKIMLLRPTESITIFIQQIGRGLRKMEGKKLLILDFVGNYKKSYVIPALLTGRINPHLGRELYYDILQDAKKAIEDPEYQREYELPKGCEVNFDIELIDNMLETIGVIDPIKKGYIDRYQKIKDKLERRPSLADMMDEGEKVANYLVAFESWWKFYRDIGELEEVDQGYHKKEVEMLTWIERVSIYSSVEYEIIRYVFSQEVTKVEIQDVEEHIEKWIGYASERQQALELAYKEHFKDETQTIKLLIERIFEQKYKRYKSGWEKKEGLIVLDEEIAWKHFRTEIKDRMRLRIHEFNEMHNKLTHGALYTRRDVLVYYKEQGATNNLTAVYGSFAQGYAFLHNIKTVPIFVTIDKGKSFHEEKRAYNDELTSKLTMDWESQNKTKQESRDGEILTEKEPGYKKEMFMRLRSKDKQYGHAFFYLGEVKMKKYEGEKPIKIKWEFEKMVPEPIYEYLTKPEYRMYEKLKGEFVVEGIE
ncbi:MAG: hypothetical protein HeimC3_48300 [Candidatus Heimdallarchaeota archaeon LC_3]|nr:MAG: hypothetical protein HeimC3_48300 [Candidatus Heimdallarchaeota archaeon LC_3]